MAKVSRKTLACLIQILNGMVVVGDLTWAMHGAVSADNFSLFLYGRGFEEALLRAFDQSQWDFSRILPAIESGVIGPGTPAGSEALLRSLVEAVAAHLEGGRLAPEGIRNAVRGLAESLRVDGFVWSEERLLDADTHLVDVPKELSAIERAIGDSKHDDQKLLAYHLQNAERHHAAGEWGASATELRHLFEESLRGAWRFTRLRNPIFGGRIVKPSFADVIIWLRDAGFHSTDESNAYGAAWGFLSAGSHPGLKNEAQADLSRFIALPLAHATLLKLKVWNGSMFLG